MLGVSRWPSPRAAAEASGLPLYRYLGGPSAEHAARADDEHHQRRRARGQQRRHPGVHDHAGRGADSSARRCVGAEDLPQPQERCCKTKRLSTPPSATRAASRPNLKSNEEALELIVEAIEKAGYKPGKEVFLAPRRRRLRVLRGRQVRSSKARARSSSTAEMVEFYAELGQASTPSSPSRTAWPRTTGTAGSC